MTLAKLATLSVIVTSIGYVLSGISHGTVLSILYMLLERCSRSALVIGAAAVRRGPSPRRRSMP